MLFWRISTVLSKERQWKRGSSLGGIVCSGSVRETRCCFGCLPLIPWSSSCYFFFASLKGIPAILEFWDRRERHEQNRSRLALWIASRSPGWSHSVVLSRNTSRDCRNHGRFVDQGHDCGSAQWMVCPQSAIDRVGNCRRFWAWITVRLYCCRHGCD